MRCWMRGRKSLSSRFAVTMSIWRSTITDCCENFLDLIRFRLRAPAKFIWLMRALTLRVQARGLSTASKFSPEYCIRKNFPSSRFATLRFGALRSMSLPRFNFAELIAKTVGAQKGDRTAFLECGGKRSATPLFFAQLRG